MSETRTRIRLLRMYFPRNWEFGPALSKLQNFGGWGFEPPKTPPRYATTSAEVDLHEVVTPLLDEDESGQCHALAALVQGKELPRH
jgi:hypothetical protein